MDKDLLQTRIDDIQKAVEQSIAQHHMLLGRLEEAKYFLEQINIQQMLDDNSGDLIKEDK